MIFSILFFLPIALGDNIFIDNDQKLSNSTHNGTLYSPYSNLTEAMESENVAGNNNISDLVIVLVKSQQSYVFFDELTINFNFTIMSQFSKYNI